MNKTENNDLLPVPCRVTRVDACLEGTLVEIINVPQVDDPADLANNYSLPLIVQWDNGIKENTSVAAVALITKENSQLPHSYLLDYQLVPDQLSERYNPNGDGEHPVYDRASWREAVGAQQTLSGYWDWVYYWLDQEQESNQSFGPG